MLSCPGPVRPGGQRGLAAFEAALGGTRPRALPLGAAQSLACLFARSLVLTTLEECGSLPSPCQPVWVSRG